MSKLADIAIRITIPEGKPYKMADGGGMNFKNSFPFSVTGH